MFRWFSSFKRSSTVIKQPKESWFRHAVEHSCSQLAMCQHFSPLIGLPWSCSLICVSRWRTWSHRLAFRSTQWLEPWNNTLRSRAKLIVVEPKTHNQIWVAWRNRLKQAIACTCCLKNSKTIAWNTQFLEARPCSCLSEISISETNAGSCAAKSFSCVSENDVFRD